jgi:hypothetical protein
LLTFASFLASLASIIDTARIANDEMLQNAATVSTQSTKDDIVRLIHLFKEPVAQRHWTDLYSVLSRPELDARKSGGEYAIAANPLAALAEIFNDYDRFQPQNLMLQYVTKEPGSRPVKKFPYEASGPEWSYLATYTQELEPTNLSRRNIIRGPDWIKVQWAEVRKNLHQMFLQYNRSGQHDADMDEWGSEKENRRWARAASWKTPGSNTVIRFQQAMIYSIVLLDVSDFESIGRKMPKGAGVDSSLNNSAAPKHKSRKRSDGRQTHSNNSNNSTKKARALASAIEVGSIRESKLSALRLILEFGNETEKAKARRELHLIAYGTVQEPEQHEPEPQVLESSSDGSADDSSCDME